MTHDGWHSAYDYDFDNKKRMTLQSVGYLLQKDDTSLTLVQSTKHGEEDDRIANTIQIPIKCIIKTIKLWP